MRVTTTQAGRLGADPDFRRHVCFTADRNLLLPGDKFHRAQETRGITGGEELFGVSAFAPLAAQSLAAHDPGSAASPSALHDTGWADLAAVTAPIFPILKATTNSRF